MSVRAYHMSVAANNYNTEKPTVVVTGFGPFGIHLKNASWEAVKLLQHMNVEAEFEVNLVIQEIPVAYEDVNKIVPELWNRYKPLLMVHCGVSHNTEYLTLESCANKSGYCSTDVNECKLQDGINVLGKEEHIKTKVDLEAIKTEAERCSVNLTISDNAHRYLCEYIYYTSLNINCDRTIFIHVPMINPKYSASKIAEHIKLIIKLALNQLRQS